ncbi:MAG: FAD-binding protein [Pseudomonadota bacterium]
MPSKKRSKIIVVGGGVSGCMAALSAVHDGAEVMLVASVPPRRSRSSCIHDGFNAALDSQGEGDSAASHARDTVVCGGFLAHQGPVMKMCEAAPSIAHMFDRMGVMFGRTRDGLIAQGFSCGAQAARTAAAGWGTGHGVVSALDGQLRRLASEERLSLLEGWEFLSLVVDDAGTCRGAVAMNLRNMEVKSFPADAVIICAGGYAGIFGPYSSNPSSGGSASVACFEQGSLFANPEFVEFHPFAIETADKRIPVGDAVICAGARVSIRRDGRQSHFLEEKFPSHGARLPRDVAVRAMWDAWREAAPEGEGGPEAFLDLSAVDPDWLDANFGEAMDIYGRLTGEDPLASPMRVVPAAHQTLGGLRVDAEHYASIPGLFAAGSSASQYHGAGTLGGNELLASAYGGMIAGRSAARHAHGLGLQSEAPVSLFESAKSREEDVNSHFSGQEGDESAHALKAELCGALAAAALVAKDNKALAKAAEKIDEISDRFGRAPIADRAEWANGELPFMRRCRSDLVLARLFVAASIAREESRGAHFKPAHPERNDKKWLVTTVARKSADGFALDHSERVEILDENHISENQAAGRP